MDSNFSRTITQMFLSLARHRQQPFDFIEFCIITLLRSVEKVGGVFEFHLEMIWIAIQAELFQRYWIELNKSIKMNMNKCKSFGNFAQQIEL